jgi:hypothetical protein
MKIDKRFGVLLLLILSLAAAPAFTAAQGSSELQIEAKPLPGQLDVLQGTAFQLGGTPPDRGPKPSSYEWEILEGEGGELTNADSAEAIFRAPTLEDKSIELFVIRLTAQYDGQEPATAKLHVRVLKELPEKTVQQKAAEDEMVSYIKGLTKKQRKKLAKQYRKQSRSQTVVVQNNPYPSWHFGFSWGWGWPVYYPIYVPIIVPPPGGEWLPGEGEWPEPTPMPYDEIVNEFPADIADNYLPQDFPLADEIPGLGFGGDMPGDFFDPGFGGGFDDPGFGGGFDDPGFGGGFDDFGGGGFDDFGGGFDDFGGGFDDFGW